MPTWDLQTPSFAKILSLILSLVRPFDMQHVNRLGTGQCSLWKFLDVVHHTQVVLTDRALRKRARFVQTGGVQKLHHCRPHFCTSGLAPPSHRRQAMELNGAPKKPFIELTTADGAHGRIGFWKVFPSF